MNNNFSGNTKACFLAYLESLQNNSQAIIELTDFTGISKSGASRWFKKKQIPRGEYLLKLRYFLESKGYKVQELTGLKKEVYQLGWLISNNFIKIDKAYVNLDYSRDHLFDILLGRSGTAKKRLNRILKMTKNFENKLPIQKEGELKKPDLSKEKKKTPIIIKTEEINKNIIISLLASQIMGIIPLAKMVDSDYFTSEDWSKLRALTNGNGIFDLSNILNSLCGETIRDKKHQGNFNKEVNYEKC